MSLPLSAEIIATNISKSKAGSRGYCVTACRPVANDSPISKGRLIRLSALIFVEYLGTTAIMIFALLENIRYRPCMRLISNDPVFVFGLQIFQLLLPKLLPHGESCDHSIPLLSALSEYLVLLVVERHTL